MKACTSVFAVSDVSDDLTNWSWRSCQKQDRLRADMWSFMVCGCAEESQDRELLTRKSPCQTVEIARWLKACRVVVWYQLEYEYPCYMCSPLCSVEFLPFICQVAVNTVCHYNIALPLKCLIFTYLMWCWRLVFLKLSDRWCQNSLSADFCPTRSASTSTHTALTVPLDLLAR